MKAVSGDIPVCHSPITGRNCCAIR